MTDKMTSATVAINTMAAEKKARGEKVYNFAAGDPILPPHPRIVEAVVSTLRSEMVLYPPVAGLMELRKEAAEWMYRHYRCRFATEETLVTAGGKFALFAALQILLQPQDEVIIPSPYWVSYPQMVSLFHGVPVAIPTESPWKLTPKLLKEHITPKSKILLLNNGNNPTGSLYRKEELQQLLKVAQEANLFVISDEVYSEIVYDGHLFFSSAEFSDRVLVVQSCSKNFAMTGWRIGFAFGPKELIESMTAIQSQSTTGACLVSQWAALAALKHDIEISSGVRSAMQRRRDLFIHTFNRLFPQSLELPLSALYAFIPLSHFPTKKNSADFCRELMDKYNIACVPGSAFGKEGYMRMAFSETEEVLEEGLIALHKAVFQ